MSRAKPRQKVKTRTQLPATFPMVMTLHTDAAAENVLVSINKNGKSVGDFLLKPLEAQAVAQALILKASACLQQTPEKS